MSIEVIYDGPDATLWYHPEKKIIHHKIHRNFQGDKLRNFMILGSKTLAEKGAEKWLSDDRVELMLDKEAIEWSGENWFPTTQKAGWKYWAIVKPKHLISQISYEKIARNYTERGVTTRFFATVEEALSWLESL